MNTFSPLEDRILVKPIKKTELEVTDGGIIIPDSSKKEVAEGYVVAAGPGYTARDTGVFVATVLGKGDLVLYGINQGMEIDIDGENGKESVRILREGDVILLISKDRNE